MDKFIKEMDEAMVQLCNCSQMIDEKRRDYGIGIEMLPREMHLLEAAANHPNLNAYELSVKLGLRKGTFSKVAHRMENMGLLERYQNKDNRKEVFYRLTPLGQKAYEEHYLFHQRISLNTYGYFQHLSEKEKATILEFITHYTSYLQEYLK